MEKKKKKSGSTLYLECAVVADKKKTGMNYFEKLKIALCTYFFCNFEDILT